MRLEIETLAIVAGSEACNARCPFCVSKMTPPDGITLKEPEVNWRNFRKACVLAKTSGVNTAMITGKGEPTLFPDQITQYMDQLSSFEFPVIELQTMSDMVDYLNTHGTKLREMFYGATIYDVEGQNVCLTNCLTIDSDKDPLRQIIFFPDGHIKFAWQYEGAILL